MKRTFSNARKAKAAALKKVAKAHKRQMRRQKAEEKAAEVDATTTGVIETNGPSQQEEHQEIDRQSENSVTRRLFHWSKVVARIGTKRNWDADVLEDWQNVVPLFVDKKCSEWENLSVSEAATRIDKVWPSDDITNGKRASNENRTVTVDQINKLGLVDESTMVSKWGDDSLKGALAALLAPMVRETIKDEFKAAREKAREAKKRSPKERPAKGKSTKVFASDSDDDDDNESDGFTRMEFPDRGRNSLIALTPEQERLEKMAEDALSFVGVKDGRLGFVGAWTGHLGGDAHTPHMWRNMSEEDRKKWDLARKGKLKNDPAKRNLHFMLRNWIWTRLEARSETAPLSLLKSESDLAAGRVTKRGTDVYDQHVTAAGYTVNSGPLSVQSGQNSTKQKAKGQEQGNCFHCGGSGHKKRNCPQLSSKGKKGSFNKSNSKKNKKN